MGSPDCQLLQLEHTRPQRDHAISKAIMPLSADQQGCLHIMQRQLPHNLKPGLSLTTDFKVGNAWLTDALLSEIAQQVFAGS